MVATGNLDDDVRTEHLGCLSYGCIAQSYQQYRYVSWAEPHTKNDSLEAHAAVPY